MTDTKEPEHQEDDDPKLKDVEPGSDADEGPLPEVGKTPPDPNAKEGSKPVKSEQ